MVKSEIILRSDMLQVPDNFNEPRLRVAGRAWLSMALELFAQEVYSELELSWHRPLNGTAPVLVLSLDSSKNFRTKPLQAYPDAPPEQFKRRERFDAAVAMLLTRTTPEDLWAALANQYLARIRAYDFVSAWSLATTPETKSYPRFDDIDHFMFHLMQDRKLPTHPWL